MPEAPDLQVIKEVLTRRIVGREIVQARVVRPTVLRSLADQEFAGDIAGRTLLSVARRGKYLLLWLTGERSLVVNPMLTGTFRLCTSSERLSKRTCIVLAFPDDLELRYIDDRQMGRVYYVSPHQLDQIPGLSEQGPDVLDDAVTFDQFKARLHPCRGEIKGVLTRGAVLAGIGNAYSDEILFDAGLSPFRKRTSLSDDELRRLLESARRVTEEATAVLRQRMGEEVHHKIRDFLKVHNRGGEPCPRCGNAISQITANQRITSYCRRCQPGMLLRN
ncbi:MAG: hypothetical protein O7F09_02635 [Chloroflexi bacterium]|nr:hypothetical protein [Chloroflexota bacterium]